MKKKNLRWEDQQKINQKLGLGEASAMVNDQAEENSDEGEFLIEYSKSNRSKCKKCDKRIDKVHICSLERSHSLKFKLFYTN